jgi:rod shape-determining protein MreC
MVDRTNSRAILTGDGGPNPRLDYLRGRDPVREGDRILTSGDGGVLPRSLPVGTAVKGLDGRWRVVLASDRAAIDFVRILLFEDFTQVLNHKELDIMPVPPPTLGGQTVGMVPATAAPGAKPAAPTAGTATTGAASVGPKPTAPAPGTTPAAKLTAPPAPAVKAPAAKPPVTTEAKPPAATPAARPPAPVRPAEEPPR